MARVKVEEEFHADDVFHYTYSVTSSHGVALLFHLSCGPSVAAGVTESDIVLKTSVCKMTEPLHQ